MKYNVFFRVVLLKKAALAATSSKKMQKTSLVCDFYWLKCVTFFMLVYRATFILQIYNIPVNP